MDFAMAKADRPRHLARPPIKQLDERRLSWLGRQLVNGFE